MLLVLLLLLLLFAIVAIVCYSTSTTGTRTVLRLWFLDVFFFALFFVAFASAN